MGLLYYLSYKLGKMATINIPKDNYFRISCNPLITFSRVYLGVRLTARRSFGTATNTSTGTTAGTGASLFGQTSTGFGANPVRMSFCIIHCNLKMYIQLLKEFLKSVFWEFLGALVVKTRFHCPGSQSLVVELDPISPGTAKKKTPQNEKKKKLNLRKAKCLLSILGE